MTYASISRLCLSAAILVGSTLIASAEVLRFSSLVPPSAPYYNDLMKPWAERVAKATNGRVTIEFLPKIVGTASTQYDVVVDGLADLSFVNPGYTVGRFDLLGIVEAPTMSPDALASSVAFWRFYDQELKGVGLFEDVHVLGLGTSAPGMAFTTKKELKTADDFKNLKIRSPLPITKALLESLGAIPIAKPAFEAYELMSSGIVDGSLSGLESARAYKYQDVAKVAVEFEGGLYNPTCAIIMNKSKWDSLSKEDQDAINSVSGEMLAKEHGRVQQEQADLGRKTLADGGVKFSVADQPMMDAIRAASKSIFSGVVEAARKAGLKDPEGAMDRYSGLVAVAKKELYVSK